MTDRDNRVNVDQVPVDTEPRSGSRYLSIIGREKGRRLEETVRAFNVNQALELGTCVG